MLNRLGMDLECDRQTEELTERLIPHSADRPISIKSSVDWLSDTLNTQLVYFYVIQSKYGY